MTRKEKIQRLKEYKALLEHLKRSEQMKKTVQKEKVKIRILKKEE